MGIVLAGLMATGCAIDGTSSDDDVSQDESNITTPRVMRSEEGQAASSGSAQAQGTSNVPTTKSLPVARFGPSPDPWGEGPSPDPWGTQPKSDDGKKK